MTLAMLLQAWRADLWKLRFEKLARSQQPRKSQSQQFRQSSPNSSLAFQRLTLVHGAPLTDGYQPIFDDVRARKQPLDTPDETAFSLESRLTLGQNNFENRLGRALPVGLPQSQYYRGGNRLLPCENHKETDAMEQGMRSAQ